MLKKISIAFIVLIAILAGVSYWGLGQLDGFVKQIIETEGTKALQTDVSVSGVKIELKEGKGTVEGLSISNPKGFSKNAILSIGDVGVDINLPSVTKPVKGLDEVFLNGLTLSAEHKNLADTNVQAMLDNIQQTSSDSSSQSSNSSESSEIELFIKKLSVGAITINLSSEKYGDRTLKVPSYTQTNIGSSTNGLTPDEIGQLIVKEMMTRAKKAIKSELEDRVKEEAKTKAKEKLSEKIDEEIEDSSTAEKLKSLLK